MTTLFFVLVLLAFWHFFYEGILAPSLRHGLRYEFFSLRDELRFQKVNDLRGKDLRAFKVLDQSICNIISSMSFISIGNYYRLKRDFGHDEKLREESKKRSALIQSSEKMRVIDEKMNKLAMIALLINNGSVLVLLMPLLILGVLIIYLRSQISKWKGKIGIMSHRLVYASNRFDQDGGIGFA